MTNKNGQRHEQEDRLALVQEDQPGLVQEDRPALIQEDRPTGPYIEALVNPS